MLSTYFWFVCHLGSLSHLLLQGISPSYTPRPAVDLIPHRYQWNVYWFHNQTSIYMNLYALFFCYFISCHQSIWLTGRTSSSSYGLHSSWWQELRVERNHQDILSSDLPPLSLQQYLHPCCSLWVKKYHQYLPWNMRWKYHHKSYLDFDDTPIRYWKM